MELEKAIERLKGIENNSSVSLAKEKSTSEKLVMLVGSEEVIFGDGKVTLNEEVLMDGIDSNDMPNVFVSIYSSLLDPKPFEKYMEGDQERARKILAHIESPQEGVEVEPEGDTVKIIVDGVILLFKKLEDLNLVECRFDDSPSIYLTEEMSEIFSRVACSK